MSDPVIDLRIIASTAGAEAGLARVGKSAESELGSSGKLGRAGKEAEGSFGGVGKSAGKAGKDVEKASKDSGKALEETKKGSNDLLSEFTGLSLGQGAIALGFGIAALAAHGAFEEFEKNKEATDALDQAMKDAGEKSTPAFAKALRDAQLAGENLGFQESDTTRAMADMTMAGLTQKQSLAELPQIMDLARAKGLSMADATTVITKGVAGAARALKEFGVVGLVTLPTYTSMESGAMTLAKAHHTLTDDTEKVAAAIKKHGANSAQAAAAEKTLQGATMTYHDSLLKTNTVLNVAWVRAHNLTVIHDALAKKVGGQAAAATHTLGAEWQIVTAKFNDFAGQAMPKVEAAISTVLQILGTGITWIATNVFPVIGQIATVITNVIQAVAPYFETAFKVIVTIVTTYVKIIVSVFKVEFAIISGIIGAVINVIKGIARVITGAFSVVGSIVAGVIAGPKAVVDGIITGINWIIGMIDGIKIPKIQVGPLTLFPGWNGLNLSKIPMLYEGGVALGSSGGSLAVVGDKGQDEAIVPLPKNWRTGGADPTGGGKGKAVTINQYITTSATPDAINRAVLRGLRTSGVAAQ